MATSTPQERVGLAFARQFYEALVNEQKDPLAMLDDETIYTNGEGESAPRQRSVVGRGKINLDLELQVFRGKQLKLIFVDTQTTFDDGLVVLVSGAAVDAATAGGSTHSREFVQTFLLGKDPLEGGFFIRNTVVRFLTPTITAPVAPAIVATTATATAVPVPAHEQQPAPQTQAQPQVESNQAFSVGAAATATDVTRTTPAAEAPQPSPNKGGHKPTKSSEQQAKRSRDKKGEGRSDAKKEPPKMEPDASKTAPPTSNNKPSSTSTNVAAAVATDDASAKPVAAQAPVVAAKTQPASFLDAARRPAAASVVNGGAKAASKPSGVGGAAEKASRKKSPSSRTGPSSSQSSASNSSNSYGSSGGGSRSKLEKHAHINPNAQCYVSNIPFNSTNEDLEKIMGKFGAVKTIIRPVNKGYGFVEFALNDDAKKAIANEAGVVLMLDGRELKIELRTGQGSGAPAPTKSEKRPPRRDNHESNGSGQTRPPKSSKPKSSEVK